MKILYIEDNSADAELLRIELAKSAPEIKIQTVKTVKQALSLLKEKAQPSINVVLSDLRLPDGSGLDLLNHIRSHELPYAVVIITGQGDERTALIALKSGADDYIPKRPGYLKELPSVLENALKRFKSEKEIRTHTLRVLYAEHLADDIDLTRRHLASFASFIHLDVVNSAPQLLSELSKKDQQHKWDMILLDYHLPGMNALEAIRALNQRGEHPPIIVITGQGDEEVATQALRLGAVDYIIKYPGYLFQLASSIKNAYYRAMLVREQASLRENEQRLTSILNAVVDVIFYLAVETDGQYRFISVNPSFCRVTGLSQEQIVGKSVAEVIPEPSLSMVLSKYRQAIETKDMVFWEEISDYPTGQLTGEVNVAPVFDEGGHCTHLVGSVHDITERKQAEDTIRKSEERLKIAQKIGRIGSWEYDPKNQKITWSEQTYKLYERDVLKGPPSVEEEAAYYSQEQAKALREYARLAIETGQDFEYELKPNLASGKETYFMARVQPIKNSQGQVIKLSGTVQDITERKRAEEKIKEYSDHLEEMVEVRTRELQVAHEALLQQEKQATFGRLAGGVAHELRNPLGVISNAVYYLRLIQPDAEDKVKDYLGILERESQTAVQIISDLLNFSTVQTGDRQPFLVSDLIHRVVAQHPGPAGIEVILNIPDAIPTIFVDPHQIEQALERLLENAYESVENGGKIIITAGDLSPKEKPLVKIIIKDNGSGISSENMPKVFEPLFTTKSRRIGLGLPLSRRLIEVNRGSIEVKSNLGKGTTVTILLPVKVVE